MTNTAATPFNNVAPDALEKFKAYNQMQCSAVGAIIIADMLRLGIPLSDDLKASIRESARKFPDTKAGQLYTTNIVETLTGPAPATPSP